MNFEKGLGQYDGEYSASKCFWGTSPGKFVELLYTVIKNGKILDLGAGEGKNSIFLAERGFEVVSVECSLPGIKNFEDRLDSCDAKIRKNIKILCADVKSFETSEKFNAVIAYGLLHCLPNIDDASKVVKMMKDCTMIGGYNVIVTFTPEIPIPDVQSYLEPTLINADVLKQWYSDWKMISFENDIITESHPTSKTTHNHSLCRLLYQRTE